MIAKQIIGVICLLVGLQLYHLGFHPKPANIHGWLSDNWTAVTFVAGVVFSGLGGGLFMVRKAVDRT